MPKIVDHDAQRETFARAAMRLMARHGLEGVTMRAVAAEAGLSYGSLFHYFDSKDALLLHAVDYLTGQQTRRVNEYESQHSGLKALEHLLCDGVNIKGIAVTRLQSNEPGDVSPCCTHLSRRCFERERLCERTLS